MNPATPVTFTYSDFLLLDRFAKHIQIRNARPKSIGIRGHVNESGRTIHVELFVEVMTGSVVFKCLSGPEKGTRHEVSTIAELRAATWSVPIITNGDQS